MGRVFKHAFAVSAISVTLKLAIYFSGFQHQWPDKYYIYIVFLLVLCGVFFGMRKSRKSDTSSSLKDLIKSGCKIAALNAVFMATFLLLYYNYIDTEYFQVKIRETIKLMVKNGYTAEQVKEYYMNAKLMFFAPDKVASFALFGYLFMGCFYAVVSGFVIKKYC